MDENTQNQNETTDTPVEEVVAEETAPESTEESTQ